MATNKGEGMVDCCGHHHSKKALTFGIAVLVVGLMLQNQYSIPDILIVIGVILIIKSLILMMYRKE